MSGDKGKQEGKAIPPLKNFLYDGCGYSLPARFTVTFVTLHDQDWSVADRDWFRIVNLVLDTKTVKTLTGAAAVTKAVEAAAAFLADDELWPWCPICGRGTTRSEGSTDGR